MELWEKTTFLVYTTEASLSRPVVNVLHISNVFFVFAGALKTSLLGFQHELHGKGAITALVEGPIAQWWK